MHRYYIIDTSGSVDTNLQLYSLGQAKLYWTALAREVSAGQRIEQFHERCVFIINTIGLSVSQLLGQNNPNPRSGWVPPPDKIFGSLVDQNRLDQGLKARFAEFNEAYEHCRHFGLTSDGTRHAQVNQITFDKTREHYEFGLAVWEIVIAIYRRDSANDLDALDLRHIGNEP